MKNAVYILRNKNQTNLGWDEGEAKDMHHIDEEDFFSDVFMNYDFVEIEG